MGLDSLSEEDIYNELKQHIYGVKPKSQVNFNNSFKYKHYISHIDSAQKDHIILLWKQGYTMKTLSYIFRVEELLLRLIIDEYKNILKN